jgi:hypothetical protein
MFWSVQMKQHKTEAICTEERKRKTKGMKMHFHAGTLRDKVQRCAEMACFHVLQCLYVLVQEM